VLRLPGENVRRPIYSPAGHVLYQRETINPGVWAVKFSLGSLDTEGAPFLVAPNGAWPSLSTDGTLAFVRPSAALPDLVWVDRSGGVVRITTLPQGLFGGLNNRVINLSADGRRALLAFNSASVGDLWMYDFASNALTPVTHGAGQAVFPLWMPDGIHVVLAATFSWRVWNLYRVPLPADPWSG
jgi:Tol biopolymer transport system component